MRAGFAATRSDGTSSLGLTASVLVRSQYDIDAVAALKKGGRLRFEISHTTTNGAVDDHGRDLRQHSVRGVKRRRDAQGRRLATSSGNSR